MSGTVFIVHTNAAEGREDDFNEWYNNTHLSDVVAIPGFVAARRYRLADAQHVPLETFRYFAIYEIEGDPAAAMVALQAAIDQGMELSDAMAPDIYATVYEPIGEWVRESSST